LDPLHGEWYDKSNILERFKMVVGYKVALTVERVGAMISARMLFKGMMGE
jgi:hypothetical protein